MPYDWNKCIICQEDKSETLKCPLSGPKWLDCSDVYSTFLSNVAEFRSIEALPTDLTLDENTTVDHLIQNEAVWHKSCHLKFCTSKLNKVKVQCNKRKQPSCSSKITPDYETETPKRKLARKQVLQQCIFCEGNTGNLHSFTTLESDRNVRHIATTLGDFALLSRIAGGDLVAIKGKYHFSCITTFRNSYRSYLTKNDDNSLRDDEDKMKESRAMLELISYINTAVDDGTLIFTLSEIHSLYENRLRDLGIEKKVNKTRLKVSLLEKLDAQEQYDGKNVVFVFKEGMRNMLKDALVKRDFMDEI